MRQLIMANYVLKQLNNSQYYLVCMDYDSILNYLSEVKSEYFINSNKGELIIDQLLVTGDGKNRFISCLFSYGQIELESTKYIEGSYEYRKMTTEILKSHPKELEVSILNDNQLKMIAEGHVI